MTVSKEKIEQEIKWYSNEIEKFKEQLLHWLKELEHNVEIAENPVTNNEGLSGAYQTKEYLFTIDGNLKITLKPFGIWVIGAIQR
ncbi:MAG TPA: hypothetical protein PLM07_16555 [Candidatus Rifleibacterium sp.]|nr:hypothetical protein [Candidatus Rifleibacterium sp.]HPT47495.1 hypothetical protein [Candidatus Rifleibacterium sp.]